ncbi:MAG: hypothetical protein M1609_17225, partial [Firmicutes bacterium]|nr:hypothetical protein [Bacillota bacterium]
LPWPLKLKAERAPRGNMKITESEVRINEVKVVVQAFSGVCFHERFARLLVMPWFVTGARLHGLEDVDQTRVSTTLLDD